MVKNKRDLKSPRRRSSFGRGGAKAKVSSAGANIKVVVRVRPPNERESGDNSRTVVKTISEQLVIFDPEADSQPFFYHGVQQKGRDLLKKANKNMQFSFDNVFGCDSTNLDVFEASTKNLIDCLMDGCNCSVFVYGATGAGKTHTMLGSTNNPGITFLTMSELFVRIAELSSDRSFELGVTYLEVYNENVQDLLNPGTLLQLREDGKYGVLVAGIQVKRIESSDELFQLLERGNTNRTQHPTDANAESSRSHAVFQVYLHMNVKATGQVRVAKLSMIDLAGSERGAATGCSGIRFTEGANINKSLLALGNCINSLADGQRHVPYRDSKLTRLLKDSLGGNCKTVMIANVSPSSLSYEDTYNTLKYATRAKKIKTNVKKNVVNREMNLEQYMKVIDELNKEVEKLRSELKEGVTGCGCQSIVDPAKRAKLMDLFVERRKLQERLHQLEMNEHMLDVRKKLKEEANARLSDLCVNTPEKVDGHKRLGNAMQRMTKQAVAFSTELETLQENRMKLREEVDELLKDYPLLESAYTLEDAKLHLIEKNHQVEHLEKINGHLSNEVHSRGDLIEKLSSVVRRNYLQMKGHGILTDTHNIEYQELVRDLQGIHNVKWDADVPDSGVASAYSDVEESRKRKLPEGSNCSLDSTFTLSSARSTRTCLTACADQLAKGYKPPPAKRPAKITPRKENLPPSRKPTASMGTSARFPAVRYVNMVRPTSQKVIKKGKD